MSTSYRHGRFALAGRGSASPWLRPRSAAGYTVLELLATVALGLVLTGMSLVALDRIATAGQSGIDVVEALLERARSRAVTTTTPHRVRADGAGALVIESATSCDATDWEPLDGMPVHLPDDAHFTDATWEVCFSTRGWASHTQTIEIEDQHDGKTRVEVLLGGGTRQPRHSRRTRS